MVKSPVYMKGRIVNNMEGEEEVSKKEGKVKEGRCCFLPANQRCSCDPVARAHAAAPKRMFTF